MPSPSTPRVFLIRHGQTLWSQSGQYTGKTELDLTAAGESQVSATAALVFGSGKLVDPAKLSRVYISPRKRAQRTWVILSASEAGRGDAVTLGNQKEKGRVETREECAEWDYGLYEGLLTKEIRSLRAEHGLDKETPWDIWRDGCEEGESAEQVTKRIDALIAEIRERHAKHLACQNAEDPEAQFPQDVVVVAHGHLTRAFAKRWLGYPMEFPLSLMMEPGGVGVLSYQHHNVDEPALLLGIGFPG